MSTMTTEQVVSTLASSPDIEALERATSLTLSDLIRFGCTESVQAVGTYGEGEEACTLSAAAYALEALDRL